MNKIIVVIIILLVLILPQLFISPAVSGFRLSFILLGTLLIGYIGSIIGYKVGGTVSSKLENPGCAMSISVIAVFLSIILGFVVTILMAELIF
jgi:hypothetical protein